MSGLEVLGVVLGGIPLAISTIEHYQDASSSYKNFWRYETTMKNLKLDLWMQQRQLDMTLRRIGISREADTPEDLKLRVQEQYPTDADVILDVIQRIGYEITHILDKLDVDIRGKPKWDMSQGRMGWEWRRVKRSLGERQREELMDRLQRSNSAFAACFEKLETASPDDSSPGVQDLQGQFNQQLCGLIRESIHVAHEILDSTCKHSHRVNLRLDSQAANPPAFSLALNIPGQTSDLWRWTSIHPEKVSTSNRPQVSSNDSLQITVSPPAEETHGTSRRPSSGSLSANVKRRPPKICICEVSRSSFPKYAMLGNLSRLNTFEDWYIKVSPPTQHDHIDAKTVSLQAMLGKKHVPIQGLSRKLRYRIASAMASSVLHLDGSPWLLESGSISSIELFTTIKNTNCLLMADDPYLPCNIGHSQDHPREKTMSEKELFAQNQVRHKTLFALAILLIELGLGRLFSDIRQEYFRGRAEPGTRNGQVPITISNDYEIANSYLDMVYDEAGEHYGYAVQRCLRCEFPGRDATKNFEFVEFRRYFFDGVVAPLLHTYRLIPSSCNAI